MSGGFHVGNGWILQTSDGHIYKPTLVNLLGEELEPGWYTLNITNDRLLVVVPRCKQ